MKEIEYKSIIDILRQVGNALLFSHPETCPTGAAYCKCLMASAYRKVQRKLNEIDQQEDL